jgi:membrane-bound lytic murein transglycosylase D
MPAETRNYVPKLQAVKNIIANPAQYNVSLPAIDNQPYFITVDKTSDIDLAVAAQLAEMSIDEFKALNPQFKKPVITGESTKILLPKENAEKFHLNLAQWGRALSSWTTHKITGAKETHRLAGLEVRHHPGSHPPGQQHPAADAPEGRLDHPGAEDQRQHRLGHRREHPRQRPDRARSRPRRQRRKGQKLSGAQRFKATAAHAVAEIKSRVSGGSKPSVRQRPQAPLIATRPGPCKP